MKNYIGPISPVTVVAPADVTSGHFYQVGSICGVAGASGLSGGDMPLHTEGVFTLPKTTSEAWTAGLALYWNTSTKKFTITAAGNLPVPARAVAVAGSSATTGIVMLGDPPIREVSGQSTTASASDTIVTGLAKLISVTASLDDAPVIGCDRAQGSIGDQAGTPAAGSFLLKTFKPTATGDATPIAATTFSKKVNWSARGYA